MITSTSNKKIKDIVNLIRKSSERRTRGLFVVEGIKMFTEIPIECIDEVYATERFAQEKGSPIGRVAKEKIFFVSEDVFAKMSDTQSPQGILATVSIEKLEKIKKLTAKSIDAYIILDNLQDPGNLGTIIRMAEAAGIGKIIMSKDTADIYNPKVVRSTMGSIFRVQAEYVDDLTAAIEELKQGGVRVYAAHLKGERYHDDVDFAGPSAFVIGNESKGISDDIAECADELIRIPMNGSVESLNAAIAATVLAFEMARQRRK